MGYAVKKKKKNRIHESDILKLLWEYYERHKHKEKTLKIMIIHFSFKALKTNIADNILQNIYWDNKNKSYDSQKRQSQKFVVIWRTEFMTH